jgi:hypothetical protein
MTRFLTENEIENILSFIKPKKGIPEDSALAIANNHKDRFRKQLKIQKVYTEIIPKLTESIKQNYFKSLISPGESVGIICSQSIGEKNTQSMLNTLAQNRVSHTSKVWLV